MTKKILFLFVVTFGVGVLFGALLNPKEVVGPDAEAIEQHNGKVAVTEFFLKKLADCESSASSTIKIIDSNGFYSYGLLQFQFGTFKSYGEDSGILNKDLEKADIENLMYDTKSQKDVARYMLWNEKEAWKHWTRCSKRIGLDKIDFEKDFK